MGQEPPLWEQRFEESILEALKREYEQQRHPWLLGYALKHCRENNVAPPEWLTDCVSTALQGNPNARPYTGGNSPSEQAVQDKIDYIRALTVDLLRAKGVPSREVFQAAADILDEKDCDHRFKGSDSSMRNSWRRVKRKKRQR